MAQRGRRPELTERDMLVLEALGRCQVMTFEQIRKAFYSDCTKYHYVRLQVLRERGFIIKRGKYVEITSKGLAAVQQKVNRTALRRPGVAAKKLSLAEIYAELAGTDWEWLTSVEAKKVYGLNRGDKLGGVLRRVGEEYLVYLLSSAPQHLTIKRVRAEMEKLVVVGFPNVIVFAPTPEAMTVFGSEPLRCRMRRLLLLPFPMGLTILQWLFQPDMVKYLAKEKIGPHKVKPASREFADYLAGCGEKDIYVSELITNDLVRQDDLRNYLERHTQTDAREVLVICLESQREKYREFEKHPAVIMHVLPDTWLEGDEVCVG